MEGVINFKFTADLKDLEGKLVKKVVIIPDNKGYCFDAYVFTEDNTVIGVSNSELGGGPFYPGYSDLFKNADKLFAEGVINHDTFLDWKKQIESIERFNNKIKKRITK